MHKQNSFRVEFFEVTRQAIHFHETELEIVVVIEGELIVNSERAVFHIDECGFFIVGRGQVYECHSPQDTCVVALIRVDLPFFVDAIPCVAYQAFRS